MPAVGIQATQAFALTAMNYPAEELRATQAFVTAPIDSDGGEIQATQAFALVAYRGRQFDPRVRAWTFTMDGHDFYVLTLGEDGTLVYDVHSEQWSIYASTDSDLWDANTGCNWQGGSNLTNNYDTNVVVGDAGNGALYFLEGEQETDDPAATPVDTVPVPRQFLRKAQGQIHVDTYDKYRCFMVTALGSIGDVTNTALTGVTLYYSDDSGDSYTNAGTVSVTAGDYDARVDWRSLGSFEAPGRLFRVEDYGALARIDSMEMVSDLGE